MDAVWSRDGKLLAYAGNARNGRDFDLYVLDPDRPGSERRVAELSGDWSPLDWSPDGARLLLSEFVSANESYLHCGRPRDRQGDTRSRRGPAASRRPTRAAVVAGRHGGLHRDGPRRRVPAPRPARSSRPAAATVLSGDLAWDVEEFDLSDDGAVARLLQQRGRREPAPPAGDRDRAGAAGAGAAARRRRRAALPARQPRGRLQPELGALPFGHLQLRPRDRAPRALDGERDRRPRPAAIRRARAGPLPDLRPGSRRAADDPGLRLPAGGRPLPGPAPGATSASTAGPRASRGRASAAASTTSSTSWASPSSTRTCAAPPATARAT